LLAIVAVVAGNVMVSHYPVSPFEAFDFFPDLLDDAAHFVPQKAPWAISAVNLFKIRPTNAAGLEMDKNVSQGRNGRWNIFQNDLARALEETGEHPKLPHCCRV
jgi:hypothetical protein